MCPPTWELDLTRRLIRIDDTSLAHLPEAALSKLYKYLPLFEQIFQKSSEVIK